MLLDSKVAMIFGAGGASGVAVANLNRRDERRLDSAPASAGREQDSEINQ